MKEEEGLKGRILKKLIRWPIPLQSVGGYLTHPTRVLHLHDPDDGFGSPPPSMPHGQPSAAPTTPDPGRALRQLPPLIARAAQGSDREHYPGEPDHHDQRCRRRHHLPPPPPPPPADVIYVDVLTGNFKDGPADDICPVDGKENARPTPPRLSAAADHTTPPSLQGGYSQQTKPLSPEEDDNPPPAPPGRIDMSSSYRRPDLNSYSLFDPDLLAAFRGAVMEHALACEELCRAATCAPKKEEGEGEEDDDNDEEEEEEEGEERQEEGKGGGDDLPGDDDEEEDPPCKVPRTADSNEDDEDEQADPLRSFESRCPPGGGGAVVLYTTSLRGIRKTFEECNSVRFLLCSLRVLFYERDVSMHLGYREELWQVLGGRAIPPRLFIRGKYIGGADEVLCLHEQGRLLPLMRGMPILDRSSGVPCRRCGGARFVLCGECSGSRKVYHGGGGEGGSRRGGEETVRCPHCNENGLVVCTLCCCWSSRPASDEGGVVPRSSIAVVRT